MTEETRQHQPNPSVDTDENFALNPTQREWCKNVRESQRFLDQYLYYLALASRFGSNAQLRLLHPALAAAMNENPRFLPEWLLKEIETAKAEGGGK